MKYFITGASGFIGTQVTREVLAAGHEVIALARSDASQAKLEKFGPKVTVVRGELTDIDILKKSAGESDGVLHLGFVHDFANFEKSCQTDREATLAMLDVLEGSDRPFVSTNGTLGLAGVIADETTKRPTEELHARSVTELQAVAYKDKGVRVSSIRLAPTVHGEGDHAFVPAFIKTARTKGFSGYIEEGSNSWPAVHVNDAAKLYLLAVENGKAGGIYHATAELVKTKDIATAIGKTLNVPVKSVPKDKSVEHFGFLGVFFGLDNQVASEITRKALGWEPTHATLLEDIATDYYRESSSPL